MLADGISLFFFGVSTLLFQLIGFPLVLAFFGKRSTQSEWWAWGRIVGWLLIGLVIWFAANLRIPLNTTIGFWSVLGIFLVAIYGVRPLQARQRVRQFLRTHWRQILLQESIFLAGFLFLGLVRTFHPAVLDLEKFMNAGLMQSYLRSPTLPAQDMWLSGETINYYSFGHFLGSVLLRFWHVPVEVGFNILLGWMMGLVLLESFAVGQTLLRRFLPAQRHAARPLFVGGLASALLIVFGGNSHPIWYWLKNRTFFDYWYPDVTRLIEHAIHEIPAYSFVVSDLHAHFWDIPVVLLTIGVAWYWLERIFAFTGAELKHVWRAHQFLVASVAIGILLGVMGMTNTWDMVVYGCFLALLAVLVGLVAPQRFLATVSSGALIAVTALITVLPWLSHFSSIVTGIYWVTERSPLWQLLALWLGHVIASGLAMTMAWFAFKKNRKLQFPTLFIMALGLTAVCLLILPEVIYFKDIYPTFPRANTMFKFVFQAFIMMCLLTGWLMGWLMQHTPFLTRTVQLFLRLVVSLFFVGVMTYPFLAYPTYYEGFRTRTGFDGLAWLKISAPADYQGIAWLRSEVPGRPVVLEAVGESYTEFGRVSVFSGLPTVLGWRAHEWLWRGGFAIPQVRTEEVRAIYEEPDSFAAAAALAKYRVQFIFVGTLERAAYSLDLNGLLKLGTVVFQQGSTLIIERKV